MITNSIVFSGIFSPETGRLSAAQGQPTQLLGVEKLLRAAAAGREPEVLVLRDTKEQKTPVATALIFVICAALLAWCMLSGQRGNPFRLWFEPRGDSRRRILPLFTCMFLHAGLLHLASNSIYLYYFGVRAERLLGTEKFLVLYLVSGLCGGVFSVLFSGNAGVSIGASGGNLWSAWRNAPAHQKARRTVYGYELFHHASSGGNGDWVRLFAGRRG